MVYGGPDIYHDTSRGGLHLQKFRNALGLDHSVHQFIPVLYVDELPASGDRNVICNACLAFRQEKQIFPVSDTDTDCLTVPSDRFGNDSCLFSDQNAADF